MSLADIKHQGSAQRLIQRAMRRDRVPHAYLFHGPDGVGKEALALGLAQVLLCSQPADVSVDPGEQNDLAGKHPDIAGKLLCELETWFESVEADRISIDDPLHQAPLNSP